MLVAVLLGAFMGSVASWVMDAHQVESTAEPPVAGRLSPRDDHVALIVGDSIYLSGLSGGGVRAIVGGVGFEAQATRRQLVWSPDGRFLLFRRGRPPVMQHAVVEIASGRIVNLLPDSLAGRVRTIGNVYTGPPAWSPGADRIAFPGSRPGRMGAVDVVYVATRRPDGTWAVRAVASDPAELTAVGWSGGQLAWASRERTGSTAVHLAAVVGDSVGPITRLETGESRVSELVPEPGGSRILVKRVGSPPLIISTDPAPRLVPTGLPAQKGIDAYIGWSRDGAVLAFQSPSDWESQLVSIDPVTGRVHHVLATGGMLSDGSIALTSRGAQVAFAHEDGSNPRSYRSVGVDAAGSAVAPRTVTPARFAIPEDPWSTRIVSWRSSGGLVLEAQLLVPAIRAGGVPPTVIVPYGGYRNTALTRSYFLDVVMRALLDDGWQVIRPNTSAAAVLVQTSGYGAVQLADTRDLIATLAARGDVDPRRVAVLGHSHGASLAYYYATHSSAFCAVAAVNGRADWVMQARYDADGLFPRPLGATPEEAPALYAAASPLPNARSVAAPVLLVAGARDGQILPVNATAMADSLRLHAKTFDLLVFPDEGHQVESRANRGELVRRVRRTFAACR